MISRADLIAYVSAGAAILGVLWNRLGIGKAFDAIKSIEVKTDGMVEWHSRADRAEARLEEQGDVRERADRKEHDGR